MGRAPCCDKANVKKGPWSPEEDNKLKEFIDKHGTCGNWIALPHKAGLKRCGKSCRLRWLNYLRPNIKHGEFTDEEDTIICTLFTTIGSRWSIIAAQLPGRTDNDIKNYWNTKLKKKLMGISPSQRTPYHHHHQLMFSSPSSSLQGSFITTAQTPLPPLTHHQDLFTPPLHTPTPTPHYHIFEGYQQISYTDQMVGFESNPYNGLWGKPPLECGYEDIKQMIGSNSEMIDGLFVDDTGASSARGSKIQGRSVYNL